jgi:hypothetical protein
MFAGAEVRGGEGSPSWRGPGGIQRGTRGQVQNTFSSLTFNKSRDVNLLPGIVFVL